MVNLEKFSINECKLEVYHIRTLMTVDMSIEIEKQIELLTVWQKKYLYHGFKNLVV